MKRVAWAVVVALALVVLDQLLARTLATREPLQAILTGRIWIGGLAVASLGLRLLLVLCLPAWVLSRLIESALVGRGGGDA